jgi:hypothetical protein
MDAVAEVNAEKKGAAEEKADVAVVDPFMEKLAASFHQAIEPKSGKDVKLKPMKPVDLEEPAEVFRATQTVGEVVVEAGRVAAEGKKEGEQPTPKEEKAVADEEEKRGAGEKEKAADAPAETKEVETQVKVKARIAEPSQPAAAVAPAQAETSPKPAVTPVVPELDPYEKSLSDGQREELDLARAAEKFLPEQYRGQPEKMLGFFKKVDEFARQHPDMAPDSEEFKEFVERQRPVYREGDRRRVEKMQITAEVTEATRKEMDERLAKETAQLRKRQYEMETKPVVAKALDSFQDGLFGQLPEGVDASLADLGKVLQEEGFKKAAKQFPVEAPIYESTVRAASEYLELVHGLKAFDEKDPTHRWLVSFIDRQAEVVKGDAERRSQQGKEFLAPEEFAELAQKDAQAARKHWTFSEVQILDMLALNAHLHATNRIKELEEGGYERKRGTRNAERGTTDKKEEPKTEQATSKAEAKNGAVGENGKGESGNGAEENNGTVSPRAGTTGSPGVATGKPNANENARFLEMLMPGGGKFAA